MRHGRKAERAPGYAWQNPNTLWILGSCLGSAFYAYLAITEADSSHWIGAALLALSAIVAGVIRAVF